MVDTSVSYVNTATLTVPPVRQAVQLKVKYPVSGADQHNVDNRLNSVIPTITPCNYKNDYNTYMTWETINVTLLCI